jgi:branched-subunit amino acid transport protein
VNLWLTMVIAGLATFAIRFSFIGAAGRINVPPWFARMLRFVPVAALTALIWPDLLMTHGALALGEPRLIAGLTAATVAWKTRNIFATISCGMLVLWLMQWLR